MISPIHPRLQGIAAERFFALGQELMRRQRSNQCDRITELSEREASWADHQVGINGDREKYKACARVLIDLAKARWTVAEDRFGIELQSPEATSHHVLSQQEIEQGKHRVRTELQPLLNQQFESPSVRKFIAQLEQPSKSSKVKPIGLLIADGREVAQRLEPALRAKGPKRVEALQGTVKPYLQLVVSGERDEFTNLECSSKSGVKPPSALALMVEQPGGTPGTSAETHYPVRCLEPSSASAVAGALLSASSPSAAS